MDAVRLAFNYAVGGVLGTTVSLAAVLAGYLLVALVVVWAAERWGE